MRKMSDGVIKSLAESLKKRHRSDWCGLVEQACVGRSMQQVADLLGYSRQWVGDHLKRRAIEDACGGGSGHYPLEADGDGGDLQKQVRALVQEYGPKEAKEGYVEQYEAEGQTPEVAKCLARAYEAGEKAIDRGAVKESHQQRSAKILQDLLPADVNWKLEIDRICRKVTRAARELDNAKIPDLKRASTRVVVAKAHAKWMEQIERIENFHPTFGEQAGGYEAAK